MRRCTRVGVCVCVCVCVIIDMDGVLQVLSLCRDSRRLYKLILFRLPLLRVDVDRYVGRIPCALCRRVLGPQKATGN